MSIIEQALDKLELNQTSIDDDLDSDPFAKRKQHSSKNHRRPWRLFLLVTCILAIVVSSDYFSKQYSTTSNNFDNDNSKLLDQPSTVQTLVRKESKSEAPNIKHSVLQNSSAQTEAPVLDKELSWIEKGLEYYTSQSALAAVEMWESGFSKLPGSTGMYILNIRENSTKTLQATLENKNDDGSFVVRWPLKIGNHLLQLCLQSTPVSSIKSHCSNKISRSKELVLKSDLAMAFLIENSVNKKSASADKTVSNQPQENITDKTEINEPPASIDLADLVPQQLANGNYANVIEILRQNRHQLVNTWEYYYWQSQAYAGMGQLQNAEADLDIGLTKDANNAYLLTQKGLLLQEKGQHREAIDVFRSAELATLKPVSLYLNMGYSAAVLADIALAKRSYMQYLKLTENDQAYDSSIRLQVMDYLKQIN